MTGSQTWGALRPIAIRFTFLAIVAIALVGVLFAISNNASAATVVTVNSTGVALDADGGTNATCETVLGNGVCTLPAAIETANGGFADTILFALPGGSGTINLTGDLPIIKVDLAIDASGNTVIIDGTGGGSVGFEVLASLNGQNFSLVSGTGDLTIRDISGASIDKIFGHAAVKVCGRSACAGGAANINLGTVLIDGITIEGVTGARGVHIVANNLTSATVSNSTISGAEDGVLLKATGDKTATPVVTDNTMVVTGNDITSVDNDAVDIEVCDPTACDLASKISITIDGNTTLDGGTAGGTNDDGVTVDVAILDATPGSSVNVTVDDNTGGITGWDGVDIEIDLDDVSTASLSASVSVSRNTGPIVGDGGEGVEVDIDVDTSGGGSATTNVDDNDDISGEFEGVEVDSDVGDGDGNSSTVSVSRNGNISSADSEAVDVDSEALDGSGNTSTVLINDNGNLVSVLGAGDDGVRVDSDAGDASNNNTSTVRVNDNDDISGDDHAVNVVSFAGSDSSAASAANGNTSDVEVNDNGNIVGDTDAGGFGDGIHVESIAGSDDTICVCGGDNNKSIVDASNNDDIEGGEDAIDIVSEAGTREDTGSGN
ncbi:MAG: hypothetical protein IIB22_08970, partial [Chloroflexi bacterium]|nr:hypothetical protein [Chloroflexota bacterium]